MPESPNEQRTYCQHCSRFFSCYTANFKKKSFTVFVQCTLFLDTIFHSAQVLIDNPREKSEEEYCMFFFQCKVV